jgi:hypothetical protein
MNRPRRASAREEELLEKVRQMEGREDGTISVASVATDAADTFVIDDAQLDAAIGNNTTFMVILSDLKII